MHCRFRADLVLTASRTGFGGKRKLLSQGARKLLNSIPSTLRLDDTPLATADRNTAGIADSDISAGAARALLDTSPGQHAAKTCSTNARPQQQCPAGWDKVTKQFASTTPVTSPAVAAASAASGSGARKAPRRIPGTVSSFGRDTSRRTKSSVAAMATAADTAATASAGTAASTVAYCAGAALYRPLTVDYSISKPFDAEVDAETGDWMFHAALTFSAAEGADVYAAHDGTVTATGTDPTLGEFAVSLTVRFRQQL